MSAPRTPSNSVDPRARIYWAVFGAGGALAATAVPFVLALSIPAWRGWLLVGGAMVAIIAACGAIAMPFVRYRVHRWEITPGAVYSRSGWVRRDWRVAPFSRIQTVESTRNPLHQLLGLASVSVTTASSRGAIVIEGLDAGAAQDLVVRLTHATEGTLGDAT